MVQCVGFPFPGKFFIPGNPGMVAWIPGIPGRPGMAHTVVLYQVE